MTPYSVTAPATHGFPVEAATPFPGLYDVVPEKTAGSPTSWPMSSQFDPWLRRFSGLDVNVQVRAHRGFTLWRGDHGQTVADDCEVRANLPELSTAVTGTVRFGAGLLELGCHASQPLLSRGGGLLPQFRGLRTSISPPRSAAVDRFQEQNGALLWRTTRCPICGYTFARAEPLRQRPNVTVNLIAPGTLYGDRVNELDLRLPRRSNLDRAHLAAPSRPTTR